VDWDAFDLPKFMSVLHKHHIEYAQPAVDDASPWEPYMKLTPWPVQPGCWLSTPYARTQICKESFSKVKHAWEQKPNVPDEATCFGIEREKNDHACGQGSTEAHWVPIGNETVGRWTNFVEIQIPVYSAAMWSCAWRYVQASEGFMGWWYDVNLPQVCGVGRMAVIDRPHVVHTKRKGFSADPRKGADAAARHIAGLLQPSLAQFNALPGKRQVTNALYPVDAADGRDLGWDIQNGLDRTVHVWGTLQWPPGKDPAAVQPSDATRRAAESFFGWEKSQCRAGPPSSHLELAHRDPFGKYTLEQPRAASRALVFVAGDEVMGSPGTAMVARLAGLLHAATQYTAVVHFDGSITHASTVAREAAEAKARIVVVSAPRGALLTTLGHDVVTEIYSHVVIVAEKEGGFHQSTKARLSECGHRPVADAAAEVERLLSVGIELAQPLRPFVINVIQHEQWACLCHAGTSA